jgi:hypothetical protein
MRHYSDSSCDSSDKESTSVHYSTHGDEDLAAEWQINLPYLTDPEGNTRFLESSEPMDEGVPEGVARGYTGLPPYKAIKNLNENRLTIVHVGLDSLPNVFSSPNVDCWPKKRDDAHVLMGVDIRAENDGCVPEDIDIRAKDDGRDHDGVEILADLTLPRGGVDVQVDADTTSPQ